MTKTYKPKNHLRIVTATSLFDGHDASINIMRRIIQSAGVEVIHLGHNRSVYEIVETAIQEDVHAIAVTSYQGGHMEFFKFMFDRLREKGFSHIKIFGGGGGVILPEEIHTLEEYGITRIYSPDDGRSMGLQGMINDLLVKSDYTLAKIPVPAPDKLNPFDHSVLGRLISLAENKAGSVQKFLKELNSGCKNVPSFVLGFTGTGGAGKSSLVDEFVRRFHGEFPDKTLAILSIDPTKRKTGGALLGDRIRMNAVYSPNIFMRSVATRQAHLALSKSIHDILCILKSSGFDLVIIETSGIGQSDSEIVDLSDLSVYVMTPEYGSATQLEKIDMLDYADMVVMNKFDKRGALDAIRDVKKQFQRNRMLFDKNPDEMPVFGTVASNSRDTGTNRFYLALTEQMRISSGGRFDAGKPEDLPESSETISVIPESKVRYLSEIAELVRNYNREALDQAEIAGKLYNIKETIKILEEKGHSATNEIKALYSENEKELKKENLQILKAWPSRVKQYRKKKFTYKVRGKEISIETGKESLSHLRIPKIAVPSFRSWEDILYWNLKENFPGSFPFAAGGYPFKREDEDPTRMFAGEGGPERTNKRFHYLSFLKPAR